MIRQEYGNRETDAKRQQREQLWRNYSQRSAGFPLGGRPARIEDPYYQETYQGLKMVNRQLDQLSVSMDRTISGHKLLNRQIDQMMQEANKLKKRHLPRIN